MGKNGGETLGKLPGVPMIGLCVRKRERKRERERERERE